MAPAPVLSQMAAEMSLRTTELTVKTGKLAARLTAEQLTSYQLNSYVTAERVNSTLSLLGCLFIGGTFLGSNAFHKPINRLVFYASMGNIFSNVATLIARSALPNLNSGYCQFQAFLVQMQVCTSPHYQISTAKSFASGSCQQMHTGPWQWLSMCISPFFGSLMPSLFESWKSSISSSAMESHLSLHLPSSG
jgi:hypothetical protein